jgi:hypothetical protein
VIVSQSRDFIKLTLITYCFWMRIGMAGAADPAANVIISSGV